MSHCCPYPRKYAYLNVDLSLRIIFYHQFIDCFFTSVNYKFFRIETSNRCSEQLKHRLSGICFFVTSTFGDGGPPTSAEKFAAWIDIQSDQNAKFTEIPIWNDCNKINDTGEQGLAGNKVANADTISISRQSDIFPAPNKQSPMFRQEKQTTINNQRLHYLRFVDANIYHIYSHCYKKEEFYRCR